MSWKTFHERTAFMAGLIDRAAVDVEAALDFDDNQTAEIQRLFGDEDNLLLALRHRWVTTLTAKLDQAMYDDVPAERVREQLAAAQPGLRALLDRGARSSLRLRSLERGDQRIVEYFDSPSPGLRDVVA